MQTPFRDPYLLQLELELEYGYGFPTPQDQTLHSPPVRAGEPSLGAAASNRGARSGGAEDLRYA